MNWFDLVFVSVLVAGLVVGRKHGISNELPRVLKWIALVVLCAAAYAPIGDWLAGCGIFDPFVSNLVAYLGCSLVLFMVFTLVQRKLSARFQGTDAFGRTEYYLGMGSGLVRYGCVMLAVLALLNAREFTAAELKAKQQFQEQNFGSTVFPTLHNLQVAVFERSLTGGLVSDYLGALLISPTSPETSPPAPRRAARIAGR